MSRKTTPFLTIAQAAKLIAARELSPVELAKTLLKRIEAINPQIDAYLTVTARPALAAARAAEKALAAGEKHGSLFGIPLAYKDIYDTAGVRTTAHSRLLADNVPAQDAAIVRRLTDAGAIMLGKLATHEFAIGGPAFDLPWPPARNPWDRRRFTGGSSSGSGAAIAAGLALGSLGTDTGGSIRGPAAFCGIAGLKPTPGLVSRRGVIPLSPSLDTAGPMAWTAEDCALLLDAIAGHDPLDPASVPGPKVNYTKALHAPLKGLRIGIVRHFYERDVPANAETRQTVAHAAALLEDAGCHVGEAKLPAAVEYMAAGRAIMCAEAYALHEENLKTRLGDYSRVFRMRVLAGGLLRAADYIAAQRLRTDLIRQTAEAFQEFDLLLCAAAPGAAPLLDDLKADALPTPSLLMPANVAAVPAMVVCAGHSMMGLPLGVQIMGRAWDDARVLQVGHAIENLSGSRARRPQI